MNRTQNITMKQILTPFGIDQFEHFSYKFEAIELKWWDSEHKTSIEIEVHEDEKDCAFLNVVFYPDFEGLVERTIVYFTSFHQNRIIDTTLVVKCVLENTQTKIDLGFSKEQNAYHTGSFSKSQSILSSILSLVEGKSIICKSNLNDLDASPCNAETGDTIDHFFAMMHINSIEFTKENIINYIEQGITFEGKEYVEKLKEDLNSGLSFDFEEQYGVNGEILNFVTEIINNHN